MNVYAKESNFVNYNFENGDLNISHIKECYNIFVYKRYLRKHDTDSI